MAKRKKTGKKMKAALMLRGERVGVATFKSEAAARAYAKAERMKVKGVSKKRRRPTKVSKKKKRR
jgi:hypothetical protein